MTSCKRADTLICHTTMSRNLINFLYNQCHVTLWCVDVGLVANAREGSMRLPHSLEQVVPIFVRQFENYPLLQQNTDSKRPFFVIKRWLFSPKLTHFLLSNTDLSAQMNPHFHSKTLDININPFSSKFMEASTKIPPFSRKMQILDFLKK